MLGKRSWVVSCLTVPLMTTIACGDGESPSATTPGDPAASDTSSDPAMTVDPPMMVDPSMTDSEPPDMAISTPGEAMPAPTLDPGTTPDGDAPGMGGMPDEPPPAPGSGATFTKTVLHDQPGEPISLAVLPDGRVLHSSRDGTLFLYKLDGSNTVAADIPVYNHDEDGLLGVAVAPDFAAEPWVYIYYSPPLDTPQNNPATAEDEGSAPLTGNANTFQPWAGLNRLSRFRFDGNGLDLGSEQTILQIPTDRGLCCHTGGNIDFDAAGNLFLSTGDDTNPFQSQGFTPLDERPDRNPALDAQRSAPNTADLRGKLLRIHVESDGTYSIPEGNLFPPGTANARPEIYAMGLRNPYRFAVNRANGEVYLADYSPDARQANPARGPVGTAKWLVVRRAANYGWPYCVGHTPYVDFDFATGASGAPFDCDNLRNESPRNTGLVDLPPVTDPELAYTFDAVPGFPAFGTTGAVAPMAGPMYVFDPASTSPIKWPVEYGGGIMFYEWTRNFIADFRLGADGSLVSAERVPNVSIIGAIDVEFGPDGALYVLEYGSAFNFAAPDAKLSRIEYRAPAP
jgi:cytochrome c